MRNQLKPPNNGVDIAKDKWVQINETFESSQQEISVSTFIHHFWLSRYEYITEKKLYKAIRKTIKKDNAKAFLNDLVKESVIYRYILEPGSRKWKKEEYPIRDSLQAMNLFRIKQQLPMVLSVLRQYEDGALKAKHVAAILQAIENFHFVFTAIASQRSSGGISFMYALAARELYKASDLQAKVKCLSEFQKQKLATRRPKFAEFEPAFAELRFSREMTKQKPLVKYVLSKIHQAKSSGLPIDAEKATIEHISPESPVKSSGLSANDVASIGNLILVSQSLNDKLANKDFAEKIKILKSAHLWLDPVIASTTAWGAQKIQERTKYLAKLAYDKFWPV